MVKIKSLPCKIKAVDKFVLFQFELLCLGLPKKGLFPKVKENKFIKNKNMSSEFSGLLGRSNNTIVSLLFYFWTIRLKSMFQSNSKQLNG